MNTLSPTYKFTEQELQLYESYVTAYLDEYPDLSPTDRIQLHSAAAFHIHGIRFLNAEKQSWGTRYMPVGVELSLLESLGCTRKQRQDVKRSPLENTVTTNDGETYTEKELRSLLMDAGVKVKRS